MSSDPALEILRDTRTIAVVGCSRHPAKAAHDIPAYMQARGYRVIPVNPHAEEVLGERSYPTLADVPEPIDLVNVFRPEREAMEVARAAIAAGAKAIWFQLDTSTPEAVAEAERAGLKVVADACLGVVHRQHAPELAR